MAKNKAIKDDWQDVPVDDWQDLSVNISGTPGSIMPMPSTPPSGPISPESRRLGMAIVGGVAEPMTLGYFDRLLPASGQLELQKAKEENPLAYGASNIISSLSPAGPLNLFGKARGVVSGLKAGGLAGLAYDPGGEDLVNPAARLGNAATGSALGGASDLLGMGRSYLADGFRTRQAARRPGFSRDVKGKVDKTISDARANYVAPRAAEVKGLVRGKKTGGDQYGPASQPTVSGESVEIGSAVLDQLEEHFPKYAGRLRSRMAKDANGQLRVKIPGQQALKLRQRLDEMADYRKQRALSDDAVAGSEKIKGLADIFRGRLSDISPKVGPLQSELSQGIRSMRDLERRAIDPVGLAKTQPGIKGGDTRSLIEDVEGMAGSSAISKAGKNIRLAEKMEPQLTMRPLQVPQEVFKAQTLGAGAASAGLEALGRYPGLRHTNPRDAFLLQAIQPRATDPLDLEELTRMAMEEGAADKEKSNRSAKASRGREGAAAKIFGSKAKDILPGIDDPEDAEKNRKATEAHRKIAPRVYGKKKGKK